MGSIILGQRLLNFHNSQLEPEDAKKQCLSCERTSSGWLVRASTSNSDEIRRVFIDDNYNFSWDVNCNGSVIGYKEYGIELSEVL